MQYRNGAAVPGLGKEMRGLNITCRCMGIAPGTTGPARFACTCRGLGKTLWADSLVNMLWHAEQMLAAGDPAMNYIVRLPEKVGLSEHWQLEGRLLEAPLWACAGPVLPRAMQTRHASHPPA